MIFSRLLWDGTDLGEFPFSIVVGTIKTKKFRYWEIKFSEEDHGGIVIVKIFKNFIPIVIDELKPIFNLFKQGFHTLKINKVQYLITKGNYYRVKKGSLESSQEGSQEPDNLSPIVIEDISLSDYFKQNKNDSISNYHGIEFKIRAVEMKSPKLNDQDLDDKKEISEENKKEENKKGRPKNNIESIPNDIKEQIRSIFCFRNLISITRSGEGSIYLRVPKGGNSIFIYSSNETKISFDNSLSKSVLNRWFDQESITPTLYNLLALQSPIPNLVFGDIISEYRGKIESTINRIDPNLIWISSFIIERMMAILNL